MLPLPSDIVADLVISALENIEYLVIMEFLP
jgi:hypothetical protein